MTPPNVKGSIRRRLVVLLLLGAAALSILAYLIVLTVARQIAQESQDNILTASAYSILDSTRVQGGQVTIDLPYAALSMLGTVSDERVFYEIRQGAEFLSGYQDLPRQGALSSDRASFATGAFLNTTVRVASVMRAVSTDAGSTDVIVSVAQTLTGMNQTLARISRISIAVGAGFFLFTALLAILIAQSTMQPFKRLATSISRRGPQDLRPVSAPVPSEMAALVSALNMFMQRLQKSLSRSEDFITEAAHRLRTPLAIVRTQAEITLRRVEKPENRETVRDMIRAIDESSRTADQLLDHAMVTFRTDHLAQERIHIAELIHETADRLRPLSEMKEISIEVGTIPAAYVSGDTILLQNALRNLIDNAIKYSPAESRITVLGERTETHICLQVCDTGPGFPESDLAIVTERYERGGNATGTVGSGLGLTIVLEIVQAHGGTLTINNHPKGGACVTLSLPLL